MKKINDRPQRSMVKSLQKSATTTTAQKGSAAFVRPGSLPAQTKYPPGVGVNRMDADLGMNKTIRRTNPGLSIPIRPIQSTSLTPSQEKIIKSQMPIKGIRRVNPSPQPTKMVELTYPENTDPSPVDFPIDMVYTWVDGSDEEWMAMRKKFQPTQRNIPEDSLNACRWRDFDCLRLSIDSVNRFAPWIRNIYVISDYQRPYWFDENNPGKVIFVDHPDLFKEFDEHLPTFNSHAIETHLHQIDGLAEHFIYSNDDTFLGNHVYPLDFFTEDGKFKVFLTSNEMETEKSIREYSKPPPPRPLKINGSITPLKFKQTTPSQPQQPQVDQIEFVPYFTSQVVTNKALDAVFGPPVVSRKRLKHQMKAFTKSMFEWCWEQETLQMYLFNTSSTRFRSLMDVDTTSLVSHAGLFLGTAMPAGISSKYYGMVDTLDLDRMFDHLYKYRPNPKLYCINDSLVNPTEKMLHTIRTGLERFLPHQYVQ